MANSVRIAVVADDLTGALDAVGPFAEAGLRCIVVTAPDHLPGAFGKGAEVIAVCTDSREMQPEAAADVVRRVAEALRSVPLVFKKIDSRLKGNIAVEVSSLAQVLGLNGAVICPAIPAMGRVVVKGQLRGFGVAQPIDVAGVMAAAVSVATQVPDVQTDADIDALLTGLGPGVLLVGARGLSAGLVRQMRRSAEAMVPDLPLPRPIAFAIGSRDPITLAQVAELRRAQPGAACLAAPNGRYNGGPVGAVVAILQAVPGDDPVAEHDVARRLAQGFVRDLVAGRACLVLTGGATAAAVLAEMGIGLLQVLGEVLPGLPLCRALDFPDAPLIVAKSGGFGGPETLRLLLQDRPRKDGGVA